MASGAGEFERGRRTRAGESSAVNLSGIEVGPRQRYAWACRGDVNAFFGLMLDNVGNMILMASLLVGRRSGFRRSLC